MSEITPWELFAERPLYEGYRKITGKTFRSAEFREHLRTGELTDMKTAYLALDILGL